jgi:DNA primase
MDKQKQEVFMQDLKEVLEEVYSSLWKGLDAAFPEFGFKLSKNSRYWCATNDQASRMLPGAPRPDRIMAYSDTPFGFTIQGDQFVTWIAYLSGETSPRGVRFIEIVKDLCQRAGVSFPEQEAETGRSRREIILEAALTLCQKWLWSKEGEKAMEYLQTTRRFSRELIKSFQLAFFPSIDVICPELRKMGFSKEEIRESGLCKDSRWEGRVIGGWKNRSGRIMTLWSRDIQGHSDPKSKYLMLPGGGKEVPFGIDTIAGNEAIIVEGIFDALTLQANGFPALAVGGMEISTRQMESLNALGLKQIILNYDYDGPRGRGWSGTFKAAHSLSGCSATVYVIDPETMADRTHPDRKIDPELLIHQNGVEAYQKLIEDKIHLFRYIAQRYAETYRESGQTDTALLDLIAQALIFEKQHPDKLLEMYLFFWRKLAFKLGLEWPDLKAIVLKSRIPVSTTKASCLTL